MESLEYVAIRKCTGAVLGSQKTLVQGLAAVESVEMFVRPAARRFLARTMCDPVRAGVAGTGDLALVGKGALSGGGACWQGEVVVVELGLGSGASVEEWEAAIGRMRGSDYLLFMDGSRYESGRVGGSWWGSRGGSGCVAVGSLATVWDGEIAGMRLALDSVLVSSVLVLSDS